MYDALKYFLDVLVALMVLLLASPVIVVIWLLLLVANQGKPFFFQQRPGKDERIFTIVKFKTMNDRKDEQGNLLPDGERLTPVGRFVRKTSLDELPQLFNVLKGDMSLVGPRPLHVRYLPRYNDFQKRRHEVRPGITGWAQVNGRNAIAWDEKFRLDVWYVDHRSFLLDLRILWMTVLKVLRSEGISAEGQATAEEFMGSSGGKA
ncbi:sugar transferase [Robiginitalea sediminis]|uniref:sugar transferase n=1 Tax=Robiginitalea sediminis TaxID=1982593 RepID=UPI000B4B1311|nr:sugar transferase [Robiginitalea sediminis]